MKKTIFVTGGTGFIGRNIIEFFNEKVTVIAPPHSQLDLLSQKDVTKFFQNNEIDYVIHCANIGGNRKYNNQNDIVEKNLRIFFNLIENSRYYEKLIHFGSGAEYDKGRPLNKVKEAAFGERIPIDDYGFSKYLISKFIEKSQNTVCLRLFGVFGKYEDYEYKFISNAIVKNLLKLPILIRQNVFFDWIYINDLVRILPFFLYHELKYKTYNITSGKPLDLITIANFINESSTFHSDIVVEVTGLNNEYTGDNSRLITQIGKFNFTPIPSAIQELREYYYSILLNINTEKIIRDEYAKYCKIKQ